MENDTMGYKQFSRLKEILTEQELLQRENIRGIPLSFKDLYNFPDFYSMNDLGIFDIKLQPVSALRTLDELLEKDKQREKDGFPRKIRIGKISGRGKDKKKKAVIVPVVEEEKFLHDNREPFEDQSTGGTGEEGEGEVIGEVPIIFQGQGQEGKGGEEPGEHDIESQAYELGRILTEKFELPNLKEKGKKHSFVKYKYDLTDKHRRTGQVLDKKETLRKIIETNLVLGNVSPDDMDPAKLLVDPNDTIWRILSREKDYDSEAVVFFLRDYSGSMWGKPTDIVVRQHLLIYAWLVYQYQNRVMSRFILHDTDAREVDNFYTYYNSQIAGGTKISSAYNLVNKIVEEESLARDYNIYVFHGTDGEDWNGDENDVVKELEKIITYTNRTGITVVRYSGSSSIFEDTLNISGLLKEKPNLIRLDAFHQSEASDDRLIEGIKKLVSENGTG